MLTDKHIDQWAGYLIEELPNRIKWENELDQGIYDIFIEMYKKGYSDCLYENNIHPCQIKSND